MKDHVLIITANQFGIQVDTEYFDEDTQTMQHLDLQSDEGCVTFARILTQTLFAFTCLPPTNISVSRVEWKNSSPSKSSHDGTDERVHPSSAE